MRRFTILLVPASFAVLIGTADSTRGEGGENSLRPSSDAALYAYGYHQRPYPLEPGPHLFVDWRYVNPGHVTYRYRGKRIQRIGPKNTARRSTPRSRAFPGRFPPESGSRCRRRASWDP